MGIAASFVLILGFAPSLTAFLLWLFYLSITVAGQRFMSFQWENLLLETGLIAVLICPGTLLMRAEAAAPDRGDTKYPLWLISERAPRVLGRFLIWWLLFRLMYQSGAVKLASNDDVWWDLSALSVHYWTQPIPNAVSWYFAQLPAWFGKLSVAITYVIEIGCPFLIIGPRRLRRSAGIAILFLMTMISLTGNYTYFNLLTALLCVMLFEDAVWPEKIRALGRSRAGDSAASSFMLPFGLTAAVFAAVLTYFHVTAGLFYVWHTTDRFCGAVRYRTGVDLNLPAPGPPWGLGSIQSFRSVNSYGLFANMTESRPEIVIEGSMDGVSWKEYEFRYKPGALNRRPPVVAPYQPRLDWQMWFAALGGARNEPWFIPFLGRLLENAPEVLALLGENPFPEEPPLLVRAVVYDYEFTTIAERSETGAWWKRGEPRAFFPPITKTIYDEQIAPRL